MNKKRGNRTWKVTGALAVVCSAWLGLLGCSESRELSRESLGKLIDAQVVPTAFNEFPKMQIKTERAVIVTMGLATVPLGHEAFRVEFSHGRSSIGWDGKIQRAIY